MCLMLCVTRQNMKCHQNMTMMCRILFLDQAVLCWLQILVVPLTVVLCGAMHRYLCISTQ